MKKLLLLFVVFSVMIGSHAFAQTDFPQKDITIVCGFGAGGTADLSARILAKYLDKVSR